MDISCCHIDLCVCLICAVHLTAEALGQNRAHVWTGKPANLNESPRNFLRFIQAYVVLREIILRSSSFLIYSSSVMSYDQNDVNKSVACASWLCRKFVRVGHAHCRTGLVSVAVSTPAPSCEHTCC
jgi:hypothetical protein